MKIKIDKNQCTGCEQCVGICHVRAIEVIDGIACCNDDCDLCGACIEECPVSAITLPLKDVLHGEAQENPEGVWVFCEQISGDLESVGFELLGTGRKLADKLGEELVAVVIGNNLTDQLERLVHHGADHVIYVEHSDLEVFNDERYVKILIALIKERCPGIVLAGASSIGRSFIPQVAAGVETGLTADCTELDIGEEDRLLYQTRPAFGGNIMATILCPNNRPQMATVRPKVMKPLTPDATRTGNVEKLEPHDEWLVSRVELLEVRKEEGETVRLTEADIIVTGGRGIGEKKNFQLVKDLAAQLGAAVGASRGAVDAGWMPYAHQVGQTGKTVCPKLYVACGVSGAIQHLVGMQSSDNILAINKDPEAPIFEVATIGVVGDVFEVLPMLTAVIKKTKT